MPPSLSLFLLATARPLAVSLACPAERPTSDANSSSGSSPQGREGHDLHHLLRDLYASSPEGLPFSGPARDGASLGFPTELCVAWIGVPFEGTRPNRCLSSCRVHAVSPAPLCLLETRTPLTAYWDVLAPPCCGRRDGAVYKRWCSRGVCRGGTPRFIGADAARSPLDAQLSAGGVVRGM